MIKNLVSIACLVLVASALTDAKPKEKRHVILAAAPAVAVASVPVVHTASVVHSHPTSVVRTEQVRSGDHASYSYSSEVKSEPVVHTHAHVAAAPAVAAVAAAPAVASYSTVHHAVPSAAYTYGYYPSYAHYYSPYSYVIGK